MIELASALRAVVEAFEAARVDYFVVGSTAAGVWGVARMTRDVDLVAVIQTDQLGIVLDELSGPDLYVPTQQARRAAIEGGSFNVLHTTTGGKVDVFVAAAADDFTSSRLTRRVRQDVLGVNTWVATPEDVVLAKLRWRLESRSELQWRDCVEIASTNQLDRTYLQTWATVLGVEQDLGELLRALA